MSNCTYELLYSEERGAYAIRCLLCQMVSYHPGDVEHRYCAACHRFHLEYFSVHDGGGVNAV